MGLLATGTSCLARVWVIGRSLVPAPPARIRAFTGPRVPAGRRTAPFTAPCAFQRRPGSRARRRSAPSGGVAEMGHVAGGDRHRPVGGAHDETAGPVECLRPALEHLAGGQVDAHLLTEGGQRPPLRLLDSLPAA